jgi:hypothetical protein
MLLCMQVLKEVGGHIGEVVSVLEAESKGRVGVHFKALDILDAFPISCLTTSITIPLVPATTVVKNYHVRASYANNNGETRTPWATVDLSSIPRPRTAGVDAPNRSLDMNDSSRRGYSSDESVDEAPRSKRKTSANLQSIPTGERVSFLSRRQMSKVRRPQSAAARPRVDSYAWLNPQKPLEIDIDEDFKPALPVGRKAFPHTVAAPSSPLTTGRLTMVEHVLDVPIPPPRTNRKRIGKGNPRSDKCEPQVPPYRTKSVRGTSSHHFDFEEEFTTDPYSGKRPSSTHITTKTKDDIKQRPISASSKPSIRSPRTLNTITRESPTKRLGVNNSLRNSTMAALCEEDRDLVVDSRHFRHEAIEIERESVIKERALRLSLRNIGVHI